MIICGLHNDSVMFTMTLYDFQNDTLYIHNDFYTFIMTLYPQELCVISQHSLWPLQWLCIASQWLLCAHDCMLTMWYSQWLTDAQNVCMCLHNDLSNLLWVYVSSQWLCVTFTMTWCSLHNDFAWPSQIFCYYIDFCALIMTLCHHSDSVWIIMALCALSGLCVSPCPTWLCLHSE